MKCLNNKGKVSLVIAVILASSLSIGSSIIQNENTTKENIENTQAIKEVEKRDEDVIYNNSIPDNILVELKTHEAKEKVIEEIKNEQMSDNSKGSLARIRNLDEDVHNKGINYKEDSENEKKIKVATNNSKQGENNIVSDTSLSDFERYALTGIKMPVEHQKYLYNLCIEKDLDYIKTLAILKHESQFDANLIHTNKNGTKDYGYMQVNSCNHETFSKELGTPIDPLDPYINLEWGTHELQNLKKLYSDQGLTGRELFEAIQSGYNKGVYGFKKYGKAERYIKRTDRELNWLKEKLDL